MELVKITDKTYYIKNAANIGVYLADGNGAYLIDTGNDKDAGKKILKILSEQGWEVKGVINTHSHADHIGGNSVLQERTGCRIYAHGIERCFTEFPVLEPSFLYGGYPHSALKNKFLCAKESEVLEIEGNTPDGLEYFDLKGHSFDMIGIRTDDDIYFIADSVFSEETISKYHLFFLCDVKECLATLDYLDTLSAKLFVPSHGEPTDDITHLTRLNRDKIAEITGVILDYCASPHTFEDILAHIFDHYSLTMNTNQNVLIGCTVRSYISYLCDEGKIAVELAGNRAYYNA